MALAKAGQVVRSERGPVVHVIPFLWSGAGSVVTRLCESQRRSGREVIIVTTGRTGDQPDWPAYRTRLRKAGVTHHTIDFFHRGDERFWTSAGQLADLIRDTKPAVIHAHAGLPCCGAVVARSMSGHPARLIGQMYSWGPNRPEWMNRQDTWGFGQTDRVVCSARAYWDLLVRYGVPARKLVYLPWGLPLERLPWRGSDRPPLASRRSGPRIGFVGRIERRKGQLDLVEAFARVHKTYPGSRLELVGPLADESYAKRLRAAIDLYDLSSVITLTGQVRDVTSHVRRWDLFVSLSSDEGQGLAVLEAMAIGVPVVARPVAGIADFLVDGQTGFAIPEPSAGAVADVIERAWTSPARLRVVTSRARRLVERRYVWERSVRAIARLY